MKYELNRLPDYSDSEIFKEIKRVAELLDERPLLINKFNNVSKVSASTIIRRFGSWQKALLTAGLDNSYVARASSNISKEELLKELKRVSKKLNKDCFTKNEFLKHSFFGVGYRGFKREFGSFQNAMKEARLKVSNLGSSYTEEECLINLMKVWSHYGRQPFYNEMKELPSAIGPKSYINKWGSWQKSLEAFIKYVNSEDGEQSLNHNKITNPKSEENNIRHKTPRNPNWRLRFLVMRRDDFKCVVDGRSPATHKGITLEVDHIIPWSKGGETVLENLQTLCSICNGGKSNLDMFE